jgi:hypothetical protein
MDEFEYDVALSFAGENRVYVQQVADNLASRNVRVFCDAHDSAELWGTDLAEQLTSIFSERARFVVPFISRDYAARAWPRLEFRSALASAVATRGLRPTVAYLDATLLSPSAIANLIVEKLEATSRADRQAPSKAARLHPPAGLSPVSSVVPLGDIAQEAHYDQLLASSAVWGVVAGAGTSLAIIRTRVPTFLYDSDVFVSWVSCTAALIGFTLYLDACYRHVWRSFYAQRGDRVFFRIYLGLIFLTLVGLLPFGPRYWYVYIEILFLLLYWKKRHTRDAVARAFHLLYPDAAHPPHAIDTARLVFARRFTMLWLRNAVGVTALVIVFALLPLSHGGWTFFTIPLGRHLFAVSYYAMFCVVLVVAWWIVWLQKILSDLPYMALQLHSGNAEYFSHIDI